MYCVIFSSTIIKNKLPGVGLVAYVLAVDCSVVVSVTTVVEALKKQGEKMHCYYDHAKWKLNYNTYSIVTGTVYN